MTCSTPWPEPMRHRPRPTRRQIILGRHVNKTLRMPGPLSRRHDRASAEIEPKVVPSAPTRGSGVASRPRTADHPVHLAERQRQQRGPVGHPDGVLHMAMPATGGRGSPRCRSAQLRQLVTQSPGARPSRCRHEPEREDNFGADRALCGSATRCPTTIPQIHARGVAV